MNGNKPLVHLSNYPMIVKNMKLMDFLYFFRYYTVLCMCLQLFYYLDLLSINPLTLLSITTTCSIGGIYLTYINPKYLYLEASLIDVYVDGILMKICDIFLHHIPLITFLYSQYPYINTGTIELIELVGLPIIYRLLIDPYKVYKITLINQILCVSASISISISYSYLVNLNIANKLYFITSII